MLKYLYVPISYLNRENITKEAFMHNSIESQEFLAKLLSKISKHVEIKDTFLIKNYFLLTLQNKSQISVDDEIKFNALVKFIKQTKFTQYIDVNHKKMEISVPKDTPTIFYNILNEFLV